MPRIHATHDMTPHGCTGCGARPDAVDLWMRCANSRCTHCGDMVGCCGCPLCEEDFCGEPATVVVRVEGSFLHGAYQKCAKHVVDLVNEAKWIGASVTETPLVARAAEVNRG